MATFAMTDCTAWVHAHDFTADSNKLTLKTDVDDLDKTVFGNSYRNRIGGLKDVTFALEGFWQSATSNAVDPDSFAMLGQSDRVVTVAPTSDEESPAFFFRAGFFAYDLGDEVGALTPFALDGSGSNRVGLVRGQVAAAPQTVSATGDFGSVVELGAATDAVYVALHVFTAGTTITVKVESDDSSGFSDPTDVGSSTITATAVGGYFLKIDGAVSDTFYRLNATAVTGSFSVAGAIGVL